MLADLLDGFIIPFLHICEFCSCRKRGVIFQRYWRWMWAQLRLFHWQSCSLLALARAERHAPLGSALRETVTFIQGRIRTTASNRPPSEAVEFILFQIKRECAVPSGYCLTTLVNHNGELMGGAFFFKLWIQSSFPSLLKLQKLFKLMSVNTECTVFVQFHSHGNKSL